MPPKRSEQETAVSTTQGLWLWLAIVAVVVVGLLLAFRNGRSLISLLGTRG